jgi:hypothetical protein
MNRTGRHKRPIGPNGKDSKGYAAALLAAAITGASKPLDMSRGRYFLGGTRIGAFIARQP